MSSVPFDLSRFLDAQARVYPDVQDELKAGRKRSHWMWFVFPQLAVLGRSTTARFYGLKGTAHARAYGEHPVLGERLRECSALVLAVKGRTANQVMGSPDDLKLCSCMTLFEFALPAEPVFRAVLHQFYGGGRDGLTLARLQDAAEPGLSRVPRS